jgi:ABC-type antimicrobial peptide transport system ATPase subunit
MMSHRLLMTSVNMSAIVNSPLKIGLKVEHERAYYKIINFYRQQNSVSQYHEYIIQSLSTEKTKRVFRHQICDAEILRSDWLRSTGQSFKVVYL